MQTDRDEAGLLAAMSMLCAWFADCRLAQSPVQHVRHSVIRCDAAAMSIVYLCRVRTPPRQLLPAKTGTNELTNRCMRASLYEVCTGTGANAAAPWLLNDELLTWPLSSSLDENRAWQATSSPTSMEQKVVAATALLIPLIPNHEAPVSSAACYSVSNKHAGT